MKVIAVFLLVLALVESKKARRKKLLRTLPNYRKYNHDIEILQRQKRRLFWNCKVKRNVVDIDCTYYDAEGDEQNVPGQSPINPVQSWEKFVSQNEDTDTGSSFERDHDNGMSTKSTGSERFNTVEVIPGPRGPRGPPGMLLLEDFAEALELLKEVDGDIKRSRKGRFKSGGPVLNIVFSNGLRAGDVDSSVNNADDQDQGGFFGSLKTDIYLQRLSRLQISNFIRPRPSSTSFNFNSGVDFNHRSGTLNAQSTSVYLISATVNLQRMPDRDDVTEEPDFEDNITGRICMDDNCLIWALETRTPVLHTKYLTLKLDGIVRVEAGNKVFLFVENNSGLNFKVLRSSTFSAYAVGSGG